VKPMFKLLSLPVLVAFMVISSPPYVESGEKTMGSIKGGIYKRHGSEEFVEINGDTFFFHIKYINIKSMAGEFTNRKYRFSVYGDNRIRLHGTSNHFAFIEASLYEWFVEDQQIVRVGNGEKIYYRMER